MDLQRFIQYLYQQDLYGAGLYLFKQIIQQENNLAQHFMMAFFRTVSEFSYKLFNNSHNKTHFVQNGKSHIAVGYFTFAYFEIFIYYKY